MNKNIALINVLDASLLFSGLRRTRYVLVAGAILASGLSAQASTYTWNGTGNANATTGWSTGTDWNPTAPGGAPGSGDTIAFGGPATTATVTLGAAQSVTGITVAGSETGSTTLLGGGTNQTLTLGSGGISVASGAGAVTVGNGAGTGNNVAVTLGASQTWTNNSSNALTFSNPLSGAAGANVNLTIGGSGATTLGDSSVGNVTGIANGGSGGTFSLTKTGAGTLNIVVGTAASAYTYTGNTTVNAGTLNINDGSKNLGNGFNNSLVVLGGGTLTGSASAGRTATFKGLTLNAGASTAAGGNSTSLTLDFAGGPGGTGGTAGITRNLGGTINFTGNTRSAQANTFGIIGGYATNGGNDWAVANGEGTNISAYAGYISDTWAVGNNTTVTLATNVAYNNVTTNSLRFASTAADTVTLSGTNTITSGGLLVSSAVGNNLTTITGGTLTGASGADLIVIQNNISNGLTIASSIADNTSATALTKSGAGLLTLSNTANTYSGKTYLNAGKLNIAADGSLGAAPGSAVADQLTMNGGTLQLASSFNLSSNRGITLLANGGTFDTNGFTSTYGGIIAGSSAGGAGAFTKAGTGTLILTGADTYVGSTNINAGVLSLGSSGALGSTGAISFGGGTLQYSASNSADYSAFFSNAANQAYSIDTNGQNVTFATGLISSGGSLTLKDSNGMPGSLTLSGANSYTGATTVTSGTLNLTGSLTGATAITVNNGGNLSESSTGVIGSAAASLTVSAGGSATLAGANTYSGATNVTGTLTLVGNSSNGGAADGNTITALSSSSVLTLNSASTLQLRSDFSDTFAPSSITTPAAATLNFDVNNNGSAVTGKTLTLSGALNLGASTASTINVTGGNNGYTLALGAITTSGANFNPTSGNLSIASYQAAGASSALNFTGSGNTTVLGTIANASGGKGLVLSFNQTGIVTLFGVTTQAGGTNNGGVGSNAIAINSGTLILNNNTAFGTGGLAPTLGLVLGTGTNTNATLLLGGTDSLGLTGGITMSKAVTVEDGGVAPNGGTLTLGGKNTSGTNTYSGVITLGATANTGKGVTLLAATGGEVDFTNTIVKNGTDTTGGVIVGNAGNTGIVKLSGANTYAGGTTLNAGTLLINNGAAATTTSSAVGTGALTLNGGTIDSTVAGIVLGTNNTQNWNGNFTFAGSQNLNLGTGAVTLGQTEQVTVTANTLTVGGVIGGSSFGLTKAGAGTLALSGANTFGGNTVVTGGSLLLQNQLALQNSTVSSGTGIVFDSSVGGQFTFGGLTGSGNLALQDNAANAVALTVGNNGSSPAAYSGNLTGSGSLNKNGSGTLTLTGANSYTGTTTVTAGTLALGAGGVVYSGSTPGGALVVNGTFDISQSSNQTVGNLSGSGVVNLGQYTLTLNDTTTQTFSGAINDGGLGGGTGGGLAVNAGGTLILSGSNSFTGPTSITNNSIVQYASNGAIGNSAISVDSGSTVQLAGGITSGSSGHTLSLVGTGVIGGALENVSGNNTLGDDISLAGTAAVLVDSGTPSSLTLTGAISNSTTGTSTLRLLSASTATNTISGIISNGNAGGKIALTTVSGAWALSNANTFSGATAISAGSKLQLANANALQNSTTTISAANGLTFNNALSGGNTYNIGALAGSGASSNDTLTDISGNAVTAVVGGNNSSTSYTGALSGLGGVTKAGSGTFTLGGANTYAGATTVISGNLNVTGSTASGSSVSVNGGTLTATGTVGGTVLVANGGTLTGTGSTGVATVSGGGSIALQNGTVGTLAVGGLVIGDATTHSALTFDIGSSLGVNDTINDTGALTLNGAGGTTITIGNATGVSSLANGNYSLITYGGTYTGSLANLNLSTTSLDGKTLSLTQGTGVIYLTVANVVTATGTTYTLSTSAGAGRILSGQATTLTTTVTNTGTGTADTLNYSGLGATGTTVSGSTTSGGPLAQGGSASNTGQTFSDTTTGNHTITPTGSGTNATLGGSATQTGTTTATVDVVTQRVITNGATTNLGLLHSGAAVSGTATAFTTSGSNDTTTSVAVAGGNGSADGHGVTLTGTTTTFNGGTNTGATQTFGGTITGAGTTTGTFTLGVSTLENGGAGLTGEGSYTSVNVGYTANVYTGVGVWNTHGGGVWGSVAATPTNWTVNGGTPGLDSNFTTTDSASFGSAFGATSGTATVTLVDDVGGTVNPSLNAVTFNDSAASYLISQGTGTGTLIMNGGASPANITDVAGAHTISAPVVLATNTAINVASGQQLSFSGPVSSGTYSGTGISNTGAGTTVFSGASTYKGNTAINSGTVVLTSTGSISNTTGALSVAGGATLVGAAGSSSSTKSFALTGDGNGQANLDVGHVAGGLNTTGVMSLSATSGGTFDGAKLEFNLSTVNNANSTQLSIGSTAIAFNTLSGLSTTLSLNLIGGTYVGANTPYVLIAGTVATGGTGQLGSQYTGLQLAGTSTSFNGGTMTQILNSNLGGTGSLNLSFVSGNAIYGANSYLFLYQNATTGQDDIEVEVVPEPSTYAMFLAGIAALVFWQRRKNRNRS